MTTHCMRSFALWYALIALSACSVSAPAPTGTPLPSPTPVVITQGAYTITVTHSLDTSGPAWAAPATVTNIHTRLWTYSIATSGPGLAAIEFGVTRRPQFLPRNCTLLLPVGTPWQQVDNASGGLLLKATGVSGTEDAVFSVECTASTQRWVFGGPYSSFIITDTQGARIAVQPVPGPWATRN